METDPQKKCKHPSTGIGAVRRRNISRVRLSMSFPYLVSGELHGANRVPGEPLGLSLPRFGSDSLDSWVAIPCRILTWTAGSQDPGTSGLGQANFTVTWDQAPNSVSDGKCQACCKRRHSSNPGVGVLESHPHDAAAIHSIRSI